LKHFHHRCQPRRARQAPVFINVAKTLLQIVVFWSFFLWVLPIVILEVERRLGTPTFPPQPLAGWLLFAILGTIGLYSGMLFAIYGSGTPLPADTTTRFLVLGPYRWVRNPMAITGIFQGVAVGIILGSPLTVGYALAGIFAWHWVARPWEEEDLARRFGEPYERYRREVKCWIPTLRPYPREIDEESLPLKRE
jgi:protein-S-isoprenylcysteine O-methyltransferase Ste14